MARHAIPAKPVINRSQAEARLLHKWYRHPSKDSERGHHLDKDVLENGWFIREQYQIMRYLCFRAHLNIICLPPFVLDIRTRQEGLGKETAERHLKTAALKAPLVCFICHYSF